MDSRTKSHKSTTADVARLLKKLEAEKVDGVILDLRRNGGGSLPEAIGLTGLFIKKGPVVQVRDSDGTVRVDDDPDPTVLYDGPLIVLTSRLSASASEILAGALQDYGRALIVGDSSTFGKGTVQAVMPLGPILQRNRIKIATDPGALMLTIQKFYRASGASTQLKGVIPDITLPSLTNYIDVGEKTLKNPLKWDTIPSARFQKLNRVQPYLAALRKRSEARIAADKDFAYLQQQITQLKEMLANKSVSLNEEQRLKEKQETDARVAARKQELKSRPPAKEKEYLITLKQAALPGLPPPMAASSAKNPAPTKKLPGAEDDDSDAVTSDEATTAQDITLLETRRILADLITLSKKPVTTAAR
jgi:carboxyl-terminal processing protease